MDTSTQINNREAAIINPMLAALQDLQRTDPVYFARFEDADPDVALRAELIDLMACAPNEQVRFFLLGKLSARIAMACITGREFS